MLALVLVVLASPASFPLPTIDGKALAVTEAQKTFRLPLRFKAVRSFYDTQLTGVTGVTLKQTGEPGVRVLSIANHSKTDSWTFAKVIEKDMETVIEVTPVLRMSETTVEGNGKPLVEFIIGRSGDVDRAVHEGIEQQHLEALRK
jgi:hypothetical protein